MKLEKSKIFDISKKILCFICENLQRVIGCYHLWVPRNKQKQVNYNQIFKHDLCSYHIENANKW